MCQYSAARSGADIGKVTDFSVGHLMARAVGGFGLVMTEATAVVVTGRVSPADLGVWADDQLPGLSRIATAVRAHGAVAAISSATPAAKPRRAGLGSIAVVVFPSHTVDGFRGLRRHT